MYLTQLSSDFSCVGEFYSYLKDPVAARTATLISNHTALSDSCLIAAIAAPSFVAKKAVSKIPFVGRVGFSQQSFYIDRMSKSGKSTTDLIVRRQSMLATCDPTLGLPPVAIFPEATTTSGGFMLRLRTGAFVAGTPIAPVLIRYPYKYFSPAYESIRTPSYLYRMLSQMYNTVHYYRLPVYYPSEAEKMDPRLYADNVLDMMVRESPFLPDTKPFVVSESTYIDKVCLWHQWNAALTLIAFGMTGT
jgi:lysophosphatidylcholine acyltransferase / lyso-PAF acetyltransferase